MNFDPFNLHELTIENTKAKLACPGLQEKDDPKYPPGFTLVMSNNNTLERSQHKDASHDSPSVHQFQSSEQQQVQNRGAISSLVASSVSVYKVGLVPELKNSKNQVLNESDASSKLWDSYKKTNEPSDGFLF